MKILSDGRDFYSRWIRSTFTCYEDAIEVAESEQHANIDPTPCQLEFSTAA